MTTGTWDPGSKTSKLDVNIDPALLQRFLVLAENNQLSDLANNIDEQDKLQFAIMKADLTQWKNALNDYSETQLIALIRFFTLIEMALPEWAAGAKSPVISINKILKSRGHKLEKDMLLWIKQNSDNRFIPNGSPLL
ncbi:MAG TPA: hypothetical protein DCE61_08455 [Cellvibrionales bacterium]|jgi:hypothetical protein|nr:hypothetical protein [Cellvibrionales bacterium]